MSNVSVVKKDFSHLFDLNDLLEFIDFDRLQYYNISFNGSIIAIATNSTLILTSYYNDNRHNHKNDDGDDGDLVLINCNDNGDNADVDDDGINLVIEFNDSNQNKPTCLEWIYDDIICVGFQSGRIICFNCQGIEVFVFNTSQSSPSVSSSSSSSVENIKLGISMINDNHHHHYHELSSVWIICRNGLLVCIPLSNILEQKKSLIKAYQLTSQSTCRDVVFYPYMNTPSSSSLFDIIAQMEMDNSIHDGYHDGDDGSRYDDYHDDRAFDDGYTSRHRAMGHVKISRLIMTGSFHVDFIMRFITHSIIIIIIIIPISSRWRIRSYTITLQPQSPPL